MHACHDDDGAGGLPTAPVEIVGAQGEESMMASAFNVAATFRLVNRIGAQIAQSLPKTAGTNERPASGDKIALAEQEKASTDDVITEIRWTRNTRARSRRGSAGSSLRSTAVLHHRRSHRPQPFSSRRLTAF